MFSLDKVLEKQFQKMVPPISEMERLLLNRQNPAERRRVVAFYESILANVGKEINGRYIYTAILLHTNMY